MKYFISCSLLFLLISACVEGGKLKVLGKSPSDDYTLIDSSGMIIEKRFNPPQGFKREKVDSGSFAFYLRNLPLKKVGSNVKLFNGNLKGNQNAHIAVVDLAIGKRDLHQCADAIMRLRSEYLWKTKQYDKIHFNLTNGFRVDYSKWMKGNRVVVDGNKTYWKQSVAASNTYKDLWSYLEFVFTYAGTLSLSKELKSVELKDLKIGDVFIKGGSPGHAVIVIDLARNKDTGEQYFMLAQSYMPAQEIQILKNPYASEVSPWYPSKIQDKLYTPEWTFEANQLMRFAD